MLENSNTRVGTAEKGGKGLRVLGKVPVQTLDPQLSEGINIRPTNIGQYKCRTITKVRPVQTSD